VSKVERAALLANPGFGRVFTDHMITIRYADGKGWHDARVEPRAPIPMDPATAVLHYAQEIFEGLNASGDGVRDRDPSRLLATSKVTRNSSPTVFTCWDSPLKFRFARDSPLEGTGFEPSVPRDTTEVSRAAHIASA
jgi:hypothetical protein